MCRGQDLTRLAKKESERHVIFREIRLPLMLSVSDLLETHETSTECVETLTEATKNDNFLTPWGFQCLGASECQPQPMDFRSAAGRPRASPPL